MHLLLDMLYVVAMVLCLPIVLWRVAIIGKGRRGWAERFGRIAPRQTSGPLIWIHAVSLGEANATRTLAAQLASALPDCQLAFSATTDTGCERLAHLYPQALRFRYPLDLSWVVRRVFARLRPSLIVLMELEVWPNLLGQAERAGVPVVVVNGRLSAKSFARYRRLGRLVRPMFRRLSAVCAQDAVYAERFVSLGVPADRLTVTGSMKYDTAQVSDRVAGQDELAAATGLDGSHRLLVAGSTGPGEEEIVLAVYRVLQSRWPAVRLALVPRKPERFGEVAGLIERAGFRCWRRSEHRDSATSGRAGPLSGDTVVLGDTMGELRKFYALAEWTFVGRSLVALGGSDVIEAAALGRPVLVGPHTDNFTEPVERLAAAGGLLVVRDADGLREASERLLADEAAGRTMGESARRAVLDAQGATARTVAAFARLLDKTMTGQGGSARPTSAAND